MLDLFTLDGSSARESGEPVVLGPLELAVMEAVWKIGTCNVRDVLQRLDRHLAYTTIMTTLDRLYKKGLLDRQKNERAFLYSARLSREQWERQRAGDLLAEFLTGPAPSHDLLLSCLVDAVGEHDPTLLDQLEQKIRSKRQILSNRIREAK